MILFSVVRHIDDRAWQGWYYQPKAQKAHTELTNCHACQACTRFGKQAAGDKHSQALDAC